MERFYFDYVEDGRRTADPEGLVLSDLAAARAEGARALAELAAELIARQKTAAIRLEVRGGERELLANMTIVFGVS
jgi:hypothetical protein